MNKELLFRNFMLEKHEQMWNELVDHLARAGELQTALRAMMPLMPRSKREGNKFISGATIRSRYPLFLQRVASYAEKYLGGDFSKMKIRKETKNAR